MTEKHPLFRYPGLALEAPTGQRLTDYDVRQMSVYVALIFADDAGEPWQAVATNELGLDVAVNEIAARRCYESHLSRAHWFVEQGHHQLQAHLEGRRAGVATPSPIPDGHSGQDRGDYSG